MEWPRCPQCKRDFVLRSPLKSGFQRLMSAAGFQPFHCQFCDHRFTAFFVGEAQEEEEKRREYHRVPTRLSALFSWEGGQAEAVVTDLSIAGCSLETDSPTRAEGDLQLQLRIAPEVAPIMVDMAAVRFAGGRKLGLQFLQMREEEQDRLRQFVLGSSIAQKVGSAALHGWRGQS